jgi:Trk-type K+ transport system membrane component
VSGGIGWRVANDLWVNRFRLHRIRRLSLHTRLVIRTTVGLILIGAVGLLFTEHFATEDLIANLSWWDKIQVTLFQSVTTRTAGFNTIPLSLATLSDAGVLLMIILMFIGASPGGTGGGIKTTTFAALVAATRSTLNGDEAVVVRNREIPANIVLRAIGVTVASALFVLAMTLLLALGTTTNVTPGSEAFTFLEKLFTCISAFGTVGLDVGVTAQLNHWGQLALMVCMFVGRVGILLLLSAIYGSKPQNRVGFPREEFYL